MESEVSTAVAEAVLIQGDLTLKIGGAWKMTGIQPEWTVLVRGSKIDRVRVIPQKLAEWDSALVLFLVRVRGWCTQRSIPFDVTSLPKGMQKLLENIPIRPFEAPKPRGRRYSVARWAGERVALIVDGFIQFFRFTAEFVKGAVRLSLRPRQFRWHEFFRQMEQCGARGLLLIGAVAYLGGVVLAFEGATLLQGQGIGERSSIDVVTVAIARELAPLITAIVLVLRAGAAYASSIATMKIEDQIDAIRVLGLSPYDFFVMPRVLALVCMMPLLVLWADLAGILGALTVAPHDLGVSSNSFFTRSQIVLSLEPIGLGLVKSLVFGVLIGFIGCLRGLRAERSLRGVLRAGGSSVIIGVVLVIGADALLGWLFHLMNL